MTIRLLAGVVLALTGCSSLPSSHVGGAWSRKANPAYTLSIALTATDTPAAVAARYDAEVIVWEAGVYALLGLNEVAPAMQASAATGEGVVTANTDVFYAGGEMTAYMSGRSRVWAGGRSRVWAGGRSRVWAGGSAQLWDQGRFIWLPENTAKWQQLRLQQAQALAPRLGGGIKVAIIDTGVDLGHPALKEALAPAREWKDFYDGDALPQEAGSFADEGFGHGTNVAGIVRQIAPRATLLPLRVLGPDGGGNVADVTAAIRYAAAQGARVINLSLGSDVPFSVVDLAIERAALKNVFIVASSGNTGDRAVTYPASRANLLGVKLLSVTSVDARDVKSSFATYGKVLEIAAPGEDVFGPAPKLSLAAWSGTSQAAPMVAGALALALAEGPQESGKLAATLGATGDDLYTGINSLYKNQLGEGRLNLEAFLISALGR